MKCYLTIIKGCKECKYQKYLLHEYSERLCSYNVKNRFPSPSWLEDAINNGYKYIEHYYKDGFTYPEWCPLEFYKEQFVSKNTAPTLYERLAAPLTIIDEPPVWTDLGVKRK